MSSVVTIIKVLEISEICEKVGENIHHYPEKDIRLMLYKAKLLSDDVTILGHED